MSPGKRQLVHGVALSESPERGDVSPHCVSVLKGDTLFLPRNSGFSSSFQLTFVRRRKRLHHHFISHTTFSVRAMASKPHPPLMKKHSQTDLISRLKSRKILGVGGEDDDGEVHRSKISQMLGNEMKFAVREPIGLRMWLLISAVGFTVVALLALMFPNQLYEVVFEEELSNTSLSVRLYGGALLSLALIMWNGLYTAEKIVIQWTLLSEACYFAVQFLVTSITLIEMAMLPHAAMLLLLSRVLFLVVTMAYYYHLGRKPKKV
ncbi:tumor protein p53-inducible protein 11-like isoform X1 [Nerophis ophidion]|uniref:tumor protein p53-inducible protein 11-like isoform X1 n=2 Tax=Nerophis ophidion TaxID=159077 RepID=UPI002ADFDFF7|nr:tumor protein p53-inducible protein 11-like isoform X1 [Nerophis ophidion]